MLTAETDAQKWFRLHAEAGFPKYDYCTAPRYQTVSFRPKGGGTATKTMMLTRGKVTSTLYTFSEPL